MTTRVAASLASRTFDLLIIGAGVYGAALAFEASKRGFSVAVVDRNDFASGTSANSLKILHGGLRYLQRLDWRRMRASIRARREWAQLGPAFVAPLACAIATRGMGLRSAGALGAALLVNELVSCDRNRDLADSHRLPPARLLPRDEYAAMTRGVCDCEGRRGALWWDALALDTERLVLELLARAADAGAVLANYVEAKQISVTAGKVQGVVAADMESGSDFEIRARRVICAGSASAGLFESIPRLHQIARQPHCNALNLVLDRALPTSAALALPARMDAAQSATGSVQGELFFVPWQGRTLVGTRYMPADDRSATPERRRELVREFIDVIDTAAPEWKLSESDVKFVHWGQLPLVAGWQPGQRIRLRADVQIIDAESAAQVAGLWLLSGPKFTTALEVARTALRQVTRHMRPSLQTAADAVAPSEYRHALQRMDVATDLAAKAELAATFLHARRLDDVVLRRTGCGSGGYPGRTQLDACARGMTRALGWSDTRAAAEIDAIELHYRDWHFWQGPHPRAS